MNILSNHCVLGVCVATLLAGCGESQAPVGPYGEVPQDAVKAAGSRRGVSQIPPPAAKNLYVANGFLDKDPVTVYKPGTSSPFLTISKGADCPEWLAFDDT